MRVAFLIDGFNLYHSIRQAETQTRTPARWLDLNAFCQSYLPNIDRSATFEKVHYFSALAHHIGRNTTSRHELYIKCLEDSGVNVELGRFKPKHQRCRSCNTQWQSNEEKETDVRIGVSLVALFQQNLCDCAVVVSGDTDLSPAITTTKSLFPNAKIGVMFPYRRFNAELKTIADFHFVVKAGRYRKYQFPNPYTLQDGTNISKPARW